MSKQNKTAKLIVQLFQLWRRHPDSNWG